MSLKTTLSVVGMAGIAAASFVYMNGLGLETGLFDDVRTVHMVVTDTNGLVVGSRVLLRGVAVGQITELTPSADHVNVAWKYDSSYHIPIESRFRVDNLSALGETYVAVFPETTAGPYLGDNAVVDAKRITVPTTFKELSEKFTLMLEQIDPHRLQDIFKEMNLALPDDIRVLGNLNGAGELLAKTITEQSDKLTTLLNAMQPILRDSATVPGDLAGTTPHLAAFGTAFTSLLTGLNYAVEFGPLKDGIKYGAGPLIENLQAFLDKNAQDLKVLGVDLLPGVQAGSTALKAVDVGQLLDNALKATATGDAVTVHVKTPGR